MNQCTRKNLNHCLLLLFLLPFFSCNKEKAINCEKPKNEVLVLGAIHSGHYWNIEKALEKHRYQGKRMLIIYGAGHKGWFLRELRKRDDIVLLEMKSFLDKIAG